MNTLTKARLSFYYRKIRFLFFTKIMNTLPIYQIPSLRTLQAIGRIANSKNTTEERIYILYGREFIVTSEDEVIPIIY